MVGLISMQATIIVTISLLLLMLCCATKANGGIGTGPSSGGPNRMRHGNGRCSFRIVRDIMRRACAYHSLEENALVDPVRHSDRFMDIEETYVETGRIRKEVELLYIRRILSECCPYQGCPPLSQFCQ